MTSAFLTILQVLGAVEERSLTLAVVGGSVVQLLATISTEYQTGKGTGIACSGLAQTILTNFLNLIKDIHRYKCFVRSVENRLLFYGIFSLLLIPDGVGVGLEIDRTACVLPAL